MNSRALLLALAAALLAGPLSAQQSSDRGNILGDVLRGLGQSLLQRQSGKVQPLRPPPGYPDRNTYRGPRVFNVTDADGNDGAITQGEVFYIVGEGFGNREGQVVLLPNGSDQWMTLRQRSIQSWRDDQITVVITEPLWSNRNPGVAVGIVTADGRNDAMPGIVFRNASPSGLHRPLPPIPSARPGYDDRYENPVGRAPENTPWSVAAVTGDENESPRDTRAGSTLGSLGGPVAPGSEGNNTRHWAGATIGLLTMGVPSSPPWHHFVVGIAAGTPNAARLADTVARAGAEGFGLRPGPGATPPGGFPSLAVSSERLESGRQVTDAGSEAEEAAIDSRLLRDVMNITLPREVGRLRIGSIDEIGRSQCGGARSVVKCLAGEGAHMTVIAFLSRTTEPYRRRDGRMDTRSARSVRVAVIANGPRTHEDCCRAFSSWR